MKKRNKNRVLSNVKLFYPSAREWMWDYCVYLGSFTNSEGKNFDLGIFDDNIKVMGAIVYGNEEGSYKSGTLDDCGYDDHVSSEVYKETRKRAEALGLYIPKDKR